MALLRPSYDNEWKVSNLRGGRQHCSMEQELKEPASGAAASPSFYYPGFHEGRVPPGWCS